MAFGNATARRARTLAELLGANDGIAVPDQVKTTVRVFEKIDALAVPPPARANEYVTPAVWEAARALLDRAARTRGTLAVDDVDVSAVERARAAEQTSRDAREAWKAARADAEANVCAMVDMHGAALIDAVQERHRKLVADLAAGLNGLPPGVGDEEAVRLPDDARQRYLAAVDITAKLAWCRDAIRLIDDSAYRQPPGDLQACTSWCRDPVFYSNRSKYPTPYGSLSFYQRLLADAAVEDVWLPTVAEVERRCAELKQQWQAGARRLEGSTVFLGP